VFLTHLREKTKTVNFHLKMRCTIKKNLDLKRFPPKYASSVVDPECFFSDPHRDPTFQLVSDPSPDPK
jgi:hypothetical protein